MTKSSSFLVLSLLLLLTSGCGIFRKADAGAEALPERSAKWLVKRMAQEQVQADWLSARARINYRGDDMAISATANLRMRKDSVILGNVRKLNIEAGRALIRPDSFFVIDRINREYARQPLSAVTSLLPFPANFQILQTVLLGNPFFFTTDLQEGIEGPFYTLSGEDKNFSATYYVDGLDFTLRRLVVNEKQENRTLDMELSKYQPLGKKQNFAYIRTLTVDSPETGRMNIEIEFSNVEINIPKSIDFEIPIRYTETF